MSVYVDVGHFSMFMKHLAMDCDGWLAGCNVSLFDTVVANTFDRRVANDSLWNIT